MALRTICSAAGKIDSECVVPDGTKVEQIATAVFVHAFGGLDQDSIVQATKDTQPTGEVSAEQFQTFMRYCRKAQALQATNARLPDSILGAKRTVSAVRGSNEEQLWIGRHKQHMESIEDVARFLKYWTVTVQQDDSLLDGQLWTDNEFPPAPSSLYINPVCYSPRDT